MALKKAALHKGPERDKTGDRQELVWERIERRARTDSGNLTVERIVHLAMDIADREGLEAISMRHIAAELQSGVMSLYYYVQGKGDLLDLLLDAAFDEIEIPRQATGDWQQDLRLFALRTRACLKRHVWATGLMNARPAIGPHRLAQIEFALSTVSGLGLSLTDMFRAIGLVYVYVFGHVILELSEARALRQAGFDQTAAPYIDRLFASGKFPNLARYHAAGAPAPPDDEAFEAGLDLVLKGIAAFLKSKNRGGSASGR